MNPSDPERPRLVQVREAVTLSPHLRRIVFHSPELADYPPGPAGAAFKLLLPPPGLSVPQLPLSAGRGGVRWADESAKPLSRTYTVRAFDSASCTLTVDFVLHGTDGPASAFAEKAEPGQTAGITAPRRGRMLQQAAHYLFVGDLTALPAIAAMTESLPAYARGRVLLLLPDEADIPADLVLPDGMMMQYFVGGEGQYGAVADAVAAFPPAGGDAYVWFAAEAGLVARLRPIARGDWGLPPARCYAVPYWRRGEAEEVYHNKRHEFVDGGD
ncbi:MAG: siderophore-interacting protein [Neisseria sp.]|nr:siderophore-interacting protein [Neisseria sp.]